MQRTTPTRAPSVLRATLWVAGKELRAAFRDRQTTLYAIVLPIALYPFLFWCMIQASMFVQGRRERTPVEVGVAVARDASVPAGLAEALATPPPPRGLEGVDDALSKRMAAVNRVTVGAPRAPLDESAAREWATERSRSGTARGTADVPDAVLWFPPPSIAEAESEVTVFYDSTLTASDLARKRIVERVPPFVERLRIEALPPGTDRSALDPFRLASAHNVAHREDQGAYVLSFILPMLLVVMCVLGAFFPAVDVTAGERERNTAETTLLLPIPKIAVHQGKILAVSTSAMLATVLNLLALGLSAGHLLQMLSHEGNLQVELPFAAFLAIAPLAILFAFFVSAVLVGIASFARTFKEGQALLGPVQMVFILPSMAGAIPGLELSPGLACVPVVNVVLAFRALLNRESLPLEYAITAVVLSVTALLAIALTVRVLGRESLFAPRGTRGLGAFFGLGRGGAR